MSKEVVYLDPKKSEIKLSGAHVTSNGMGLTLNGNVSLEEIKGLGLGLKRMSGAVQFWIGDWINGDWGNFEKDKDVIAKSVGYQPGSLKTLSEVSKNIPKDIRLTSDILNWTHFEALSSLITNKNLKLPPDIKKEVDKWRTDTKNNKNLSMPKIIKDFILEWRDRSIKRRYTKNQVRFDIDVAYGVRSTINLRTRFGEVPFNVFDTTAPEWVEANIVLEHSLGIQSELGREENLLSMSDKCITKSSIFDLNLTRLMPSWFCTLNGTILDPFAGGSARGMVSEHFDYVYTGIELSEKQVKANEEQAKVAKLNPTWITGDSNKVLDSIKQEFDFIFTCPPYYDLEVYSDLPGELSNLGTYKEFLETYSSIIKKSCDKLKDNRFACIVVSNIRDKEGYYRNFVGDTIELFEKCGLRLYNVAVLVNSVGSLRIRVQKMFKGNRKLGSRHQHVLVFYKGDAKKIKDIFGVLGERKGDIKESGIEDWGV